MRCALTHAEADPNRKKSTGPELAGALDSDPDIYVPETLEVEADESDFVLPEPSWKVSKMEVSATDADFEMFTASTDDKELVIEVEPHRALHGTDKRSDSLSPTGNFKRCR